MRPMEEKLKKLQEAAKESNDAAKKESVKKEEQVEVKEPEPVKEIAKEPKPEQKEQPRGEEKEKLSEEKEVTEAKEPKKTPVEKLDAIARARKNQKKTEERIASTVQERLMEEMLKRIPPVKEEKPEVERQRFPDPILEEEEFQKRISEIVEERAQQLLKPLQEQMLMSRLETEYSGWQQTRAVLSQKDPQFESAFSYLEELRVKELLAQNPQMTDEQIRFQLKMDTLVLKNNMQQQGFTSPEAQMRYIKLAAETLGYQIDAEQEEESTAPSLGERRAMKERTTTLAGLPKRGGATQELSLDKYNKMPLREKALLSKQEVKEILKRGRK